MKRLFTRTLLGAVLLLQLTIGGIAAQDIDLIAQFGNYDLAEYRGYPLNGTYVASAGKTSGIIPAGTAMVIVTLSPDAPWNGTAFTIPAGWALDPSSTPDNLTFVNTADWTTTDDFYVEIPITTIKPTTTGPATVGTQVVNAGGDWVDTDPNDNATISHVTVLDEPLPVTLVSFSIAKESQTALLSWATTSETNSDHFEIERSGNGKQWDKIGSVASSGESKSLKNYSFVDSEPLGGENLYRLKMVDRDQTFAYSRIRTLRFEGGSGLIVYPNPASDVLHIGSGSTKDIKQVLIVDQAGRVVYRSGDKPSTSIGIGTLPSGLYIVSVSYLNGETKNDKLLINR